MNARAPNRIREFREKRGLTQLALAALVKITRQSLFAIESGRVHPSVDIALRLARSLACSVEELFSDERPVVVASEYEPKSGSHASGARVAMAHLAGRWVSFDMSAEHAMLAADGIVANVEAEHPEIELLRARDEIQENIMVMGCALGLGVVASLFNQKGCGAQVRWQHRSSIAALRALAGGYTHVAGLHLVDDESGEENVADVRRLHHPASISLVTLARWEAGLVMRRSDTHRLRAVEDLALPELRIVGRETGAGAQRLLERTMREARLPAHLALQPKVRATSHADVARAIQWGAADVGVATRDIAVAFDLDFLPLAHERFDLAILSSDLADPRIERLIDVVASLPVRRELTAMGYDPRDAGDRVCEISAA